GIPLALAVEAASETVSACAKQGFHETAVVVDADGAIIVTLRGDGTGIHTLDSAHDKAYTAVSFKNDTLALAERAKGEDSIAPLSKLPHVMFFGGGVVIKVGNETIGAIVAAGAPGAKLDDGCAHAGLDKIRDRLE
ncbi:GlcG/HbpS family heme-binding protein, partial [Roseiarcus sp.]|uniref:GlcG/HbpS family heme-binding protein n=1 Tax=Roseiarcus sp. TaxID=1969460 RepID=UPI003C51026D